MRKCDNFVSCDKKEQCIGKTEGINKEREGMEEIHETRKKEDLANVFGLEVSSFWGAWVA